MKIYFKNKFTMFLAGVVIFSICFLLTGCSKPSTADPTGTITATITNRGKIMVDSSHAPFAFIGYTDTTGTYNFFAGNGLITSIGNVADLAAITSKPSSGFNNAVAAVVGNGYVLIYQSGSYCRLYCVSMSGNTATVKYQYPY
jgi:hypothetical protein